LSGARPGKPVPVDDAVALGHDVARAAYLSDAFQLNDTILMVDTLSAVARACGLETIAERTGIPLPALQRSLASDAIPDLQTFTSVIGALGLRLAVVPAKASGA
jgi:probable addiction module antidote protein